MFTSRLARCARIPPFVQLHSINSRIPIISRNSGLRNTRPYSNFPGGRSRYVRFGSDSPQDESFWDVWRWEVKSQVAVSICVLIVGYYLVHLEQVPETGRWRFMDMNPKYEAKLAEELRQDLLNSFQGKILPPDHPVTRHIRRVTSRILEASDLGTLDSPDVVNRRNSAKDTLSFGQTDGIPEAGGSKTWRLLVVNDDSIINASAAFGNIVVYTGILPVAKDEHGLAAVIGHEIGHCVARHSVESYSSIKILILLGIILDAVGVPFSYWVSKLVYELPNSRKYEYEADKIGLRLSARACFDPEAVPEFFVRLARDSEATGGEGVDFLNTHPTSEKRSKALREMLPEAYAAQASSPMCGSTADHMAAFKDTWLGGMDPDKMSEVRWP